MIVFSDKGTRKDVAINNKAVNMQLVLVVIRSKLHDVTTETSMMVLVSGTHLAVVLGLLIWQSIKKYKLTLLLNSYKKTNM